MDCPRCKKKLHNVHSVSMVSGMVRDEGLTATISNGYSCWNCGTWVEEEFSPVCPMPDVIKGKPVPAYRARNARAASKHALKVKENYDAILSLRLKGKSYDFIVNELSLDMSRTRLCKIFSVQVPQESLPVPDRRCKRHTCNKILVKGASEMMHNFIKREHCNKSCAMLHAREKKCKSKGQTTQSMVSTKGPTT